MSELEEHIKSKALEYCFLPLGRGAGKTLGLETREIVRQAYIDGAMEALKKHHNTS